MAANVRVRNLCPCRARLPLPSVLDGDDDLVGPDQAEILADQLLGEIRVGAARVEQLGAVREARALVDERGELDLPLLLLPAIVAPAQYAVRADDRIAEEIGDDEQGERRYGGPPDDLNRILPHRRHDAFTESVKAPRIKLFAQLP